MKTEDMSLTEFWAKLDAGELEPSLGSAQLPEHPALNKLAQDGAVAMTHRDIQQAGKELRGLGVEPGNLNKTTVIRDRWAASQGRKNEPELAKSDYMDS
jgi:hypothetical protein